MYLTGSMSFVKHPFIVILLIPVLSQVLSQIRSSRSSPIVEMHWYESWRTNSEGNMILMVSESIILFAFQGLGRFEGEYSLLMVMEYVVVVFMILFCRETVTACMENPE